MKNKILLILTGGTICSDIKNNIINVSENNSGCLLDLSKQYINTEIEFDIIQPYNILSENIDYSYWNLLIKTLREVKKSKYDGIIITHGSDTLAYTSALISLCFSDTKIPIIFVASNYPLSNKLSNGLQNFIDAIRYISDKNNPSGVFVIYANNKKESILYLGSRLVEADFFENNFRSFNGVDFGIIENGIVQFNKNNSLPSLEEFRYRPRCNNSEVALKDNIMLLTPYPNIDYGSIILKDNLKAIFHYTYHSATLNKSVIDFIKECKNRNIDFYVPVKNSDVIYDSSYEVIKAGAKPLGFISKECGFVKLILAYNQDKLSVDKFLKQNIFFEQF